MIKKYMRTLILAISLFAVVGSMIGCSYQTIETGYVGVKVYKMGQKKGVDNEVVGVGRYWLTWNEDLYEYPVFVNMYRFTAGVNDDSPSDEAFYFSNKDGVKCDIDVAIQAQADPSKVSLLFQKYRSEFKDVMKTNLRTSINKYIQKYASAMSVEELYGPKKVEMIEKVEADLRAECAQFGIHVISVTLLSDIRFPLQVQDAITAKIKVTQEALEAQNRVVKAKADADAKIATARGEAESIRLKQQTVTDTLIRYEAVMNQRVLAERWDGQSWPTYMAGNTPFTGLFQMK